jgi:chromosome segregation ATPase
MELSPDQELEFPLAEVRSTQTSVSLRELDRNQLQVHFSGKETPASLREKLQEIVAAREQLGSLRNRVSAVQRDIDQIFRDQERLRENLKALRDTREERGLRQQYLDQLSGQEQQIEELRGQVESLNRQIADQEAQLSDLISTLTWEAEL